MIWNCLSSIVWCPISIRCLNSITHKNSSSTTSLLKQMTQDTSTIIIENIYVIMITDVYYEGEYYIMKMQSKVRYVKLNHFVDFNALLNCNCDCKTPGRFLDCRIFSDVTPWRVVYDLLCLTRDPSLDICICAVWKHDEIVSPKTELMTELGHHPRKGDPISS